MTMILMTYFKKFYVINIKDLEQGKLSNIPGFKNTVENKF